MQAEEIFGLMNGKVSQIKGEVTQLGSDVSQLNADLQEIANSGVDVEARASIGTMANLSTAEKTSLVEAINEVNAKPSGGGGTAESTTYSSLVSGASADDCQAAIDELFSEKLDKANVANNNTVATEGFALDARQANPSVVGSLGAQIATLNDNLAE